MKRSILSNHKAARITIALIFWLAIWQIVSLCTPKILFASPAQTFYALTHLLLQGDFWLSIARTLGFVSLGFLLGFALGLLFALLSHSSIWGNVLLRPAVQVTNSVPVACFIVVALIWISSVYISILVSLFVALPITYVSTRSALKQLDPQLTEMLTVFRVPLAKRIRTVYLPQMLPEILAGCRMSVAMCWKAGIAGEIIGLPAHTIGEHLYLAKLYLSIDTLFAWTIVIILLSFTYEKLLIHLLRAVQRKLEVLHAYRAT